MQTSSGTGTGSVTLAAAQYLMSKLTASVQSGGKMMKTVEFFRLAGHSDEVHPVTNHLGIESQ